MSRKKIVLLFLIILILSACSSPSPSIEHRLSWWIDGFYNLEKNHPVLIAIIDTGVYKDHPDIKNAVKDEYIVPGLQSNIMSNIHHGTAIAGIIAAYPNNKEGVLGVNPSAQIVSIIATNNNESIEVDKMINGIEYAIQEKADIINISSGIKSDNESLHNIIKRAYDEGIIIVASAGDFNNEPILYPARYDEVVAISSYGKSNKVLYSYSFKEQENKVIYLPGENLTTTDWKENEDYENYVSASGTSFSTAIMSGIISNIVKKNENVSNIEIYKYLGEFYGKLITKDDIKDIYSLK